MVAGKVKAIPIWFRETRFATAMRELDWWYQRHAFVTQVVFTLLYRLILDGIYIGQLGPIFGDAGFTVDVRPFSYLCSLTAIILFAPFMAYLCSQHNASSIFLNIINYTYFIPLTSYYGCCGKVATMFFVIALAYWALLLFWQMILPRLYLKQVYLVHGRIAWIMLTVLACAVVLYVSGRYTGFRIFLETIDVYNVRAEAAGYDMPKLLSYALSMMAICLSCMMAYWLKEKKYVIVAVLVLVYLLYYSIAAHKSVFLFAIFLLGCFYFYRSWMLRWLPVLMSGAISLLGFLSRVTDNNVPVSLFVRRFMYVPVVLSESHYRFFAEHPRDLFRSGVMGKLGFAETYTQNVPRLMGEFDYHPLTNENNGLLGDMFENLPIVLGLVLMPLILILCFRLLDLGSRKLDERITIAFCVFYASAFSNGSWSTVLLTHGFLLACVLLYLFPREEGLISGKDL